VGIIAVGQGSTKPGCLIHLRYTPPNAKDHIALVGKGVTFDAGGLSLKPSNSMQTMRCDMGGAACALGAFGAIAATGVPITVDAFVPSVENMCAANSYKLGDILKYRNGVSVEIHNTDAEGRLILADALTLACEVEGVSRVVDLATLTGAVVVAIGSDFTGLFTHDDDLAEEILGGAASSSELVWRMPLHTPYNRMLKGTWGQIKNVGAREAGSITAALFLEHFVTDDVRWAHLDVAGTAFIDSPVPPYIAGATGQMVRGLTNWAESISG
jgi:leucyl aminopeptidase